MDGPSLQDFQCVLCRGVIDPRRRAKSGERRAGRAELAGWKHAATRKSPDFRGRSNLLALVAIFN
jgi:hypothetical protein